MLLFCMYLCSELNLVFWLCIWMFVLLLSLCSWVSWDGRCLCEVKVGSIVIVLWIVCCVCWLVSLSGFWEWIIMNLFMSFLCCCGRSGIVMCCFFFVGMFSCCCFLGVFVVGC